MYVVETPNEISDQSYLGALAFATALAAKTAAKESRGGTFENPDAHSFLANPGSEKALKDALASEVTANYPEADMKELMYRKMSKGDPHYPGVLHSRSVPDKDGYKYQLQYAPEQDKAIMAHEAGHYLNHNSPVMRQVAAARHFLGNNPSLNSALKKGMELGPVSIGPIKGLNAQQIFKGSRYLAPAAIAGLMPGDDDVAASVAINLALSAPLLTDEIMATKRGFDLIDKAGLEAPLRSKARMAGAFTSYLANPLLAAFAGNMTGNLIDQNV